MLEQQEPSPNEQQTQAYRDPASSIFTNALASRLLSATVVESSPSMPHLSLSTSSDNTPSQQLAASSLSLEGEPRPLPPADCPGGTNWRWVSQWQCSSPRLPGGPLHGGCTIQGGQDNKSDGGDHSQIVSPLDLGSTGGGVTAREEEEACCDALGLVQAC